MKIQLLAEITHEVKLAVEDRYIKSYHPDKYIHAEVYIERVEKDSRYPWILIVEGTVLLEDGIYEWDTRFDVNEEEWMYIRYFFGGQICFTCLED